MVKKSHIIFVAGSIFVNCNALGVLSEGENRFFWHDGKTYTFGDWKITEGKDYNKYAEAIGKTKFDSSKLQFVVEKGSRLVIKMKGLQDCFDFGGVDDDAKGEVNDLVENMGFPINCVEKTGVAMVHYNKEEGSDINEGGFIILMYLKKAGKIKEIVRDKNLCVRKIVFVENGVEKAFDFAEHYPADSVDKPKTGDKKESGSENSGNGSGNSSGADTNSKDNKSSLCCC